MINQDFKSLLYLKKYIRWNQSELFPDMYPVPPPHRRHLARSLPVPRGSIHTGGFLSRLALSGAVGQKSQQCVKQEVKPRGQIHNTNLQWTNQIHFTPLLVKTSQYGLPVVQPISKATFCLTVITYHCFDW